MRSWVAALIASAMFGCGGSGSGGAGPGSGGTGGGGGGGGACGGQDPCPGQCNAQGWCFIDEVSMPLWVDVWGSSPNDVWLLPQDPSVWHFDGQGWTQMSLPTTYDVDRIWGRASDDVWVGGGSGQLAHYDGAKWTAESLPPNERVQSFWSDAPGGPVLALGSSGTLYERGSAGWEPKVTLPKNDAQGRSANLLGCSGAHYATGARLYSDAEGSWMGYGISNGPEVSPVTSTLALGAGRVWVTVGTLMRYNGSIWRSDVAEQAFGPLVALAGTSEQDAWALTEDQRLLRSTGKGFSEALGAGQVGSTKWIKAAGSGLVELADPNGKIVRFDGSTTTNVISGGLSGSALGVGWATSGEPLALTSTGLFAVDTVNGSWKKLGSVSSLGATEASISATSPSDVWCAAGNQVLHWDGSQLSAVSLPGPGSLHYRAVLALSPKDVWVAAPDATLHYDGTSWTSMASDPTLGNPGSQARVALVGNATDDLWVIRDRNRFAHFDGKQLTEVSASEWVGTLGCGASPGEVIGLGVQPAPLYAGKPGNMKLVAPSLVDGYGVSEGWIGAPDDIWLTGYEPSSAGKQILRYDGTFSVSVDASGHSLIALWAFPGGEVYAVGYNAILHRVPK